MTNRMTPGLPNIFPSLYYDDAPAAIEWLERAYKQRDSGLTQMKGDPLLRNIEKDPRYTAFLKKINLPEN